MRTSAQYQAKIIQKRARINKDILSRGKLKAYERIELDAE